MDDRSQLSPSVPPATFLRLCCLAAWLFAASHSVAAEPEADSASQALTANSTTGRDSHTAQRAELQTFLTELVRIRQTGDGLAYGRLFDMQRLMRELGNQGVLQGAGFTRVLTLWLNLQYGLRVGSMFHLEHDDATMDDFRLGQVRFNAQGDEAEAFILCRSQMTDPWWARIWFIKRDGRWLMFDHQRLDSGVRFTTNLAELGRSNLAEKESWRRAKELVDQSWQSIQYGYGDDNAIQVNLQTARPLDKHPSTEVRRRLYEVYVAVNGYGDEAAALPLFDALMKLPDVAQQQPIVWLLRARLAGSQGEAETALKAANEFISQVGADEEVCSILGEALLKLERAQEAAEAFRLGLSVDPGSVDCLTGLAEALPADEADEVGRLFAKIPDPRGSFESVAMELDSRERADALLAVVKAYRAIDADDPNADYYEAMAWRTKQQPRKAADLLKKAIPHVADKDERSYYEEAYFQAMIDAKSVTEAYREATNPQESFIKLVELLDRTDKYDQMRGLIELHRERFPRDPQVYLHLGGLEQREHHLDEADEVLAIGMRYALDAETLEALRSKRVDVAVEAKRAIEAYKTIPPRRKTFLDLATLLRDTNQVEVLEKLVSMHRQQDSRDPVLPMWEAEVFWLKKDYPAAARSLIAGRERLVESDFPLWTFEDRLIRSLVRSGRFEEAENIAMGIKARDDDQWFLLMVYAVWQDEDAAMQAARAWLDSTDYGAAETLAEMYADEDIGPALRSKAFARFRAKFPAPKQ